MFSRACCAVIFFYEIEDAKFFLFQVRYNFQNNNFRLSNKSSLPVWYAQYYNTLRKTSDYYLLFKFILHSLLIDSTSIHIQLSWSNCYGCNDRGRHCQGRNSHLCTQQRGKHPRIFFAANILRVLIGTLKKYLICAYVRPFGYPSNAQRCAYQLHFWEFIKCVYLIRLRQEF